MAEIGIVASIIGVAGAGFRLSLILNAVGCQIANAPSEIHEISKSVSLFSLLLKQTAAVLDQTSSVHSEEAIQTTEQVLHESNAVFREINTMLERMRSRREDGTISPSMKQRFKWCFKKHGVLYLLGRIDRLQMSLSLMLQILQLGSSMASTSRNDPPLRVKEMSDKIKRERVEAQNFVVLYYCESKEVDRLYEATKQEELEPHSPIEFRREDSGTLTRLSSDGSQLAKVESLHVVTDDDLTVKPPARALCEIDDQWKRLDRSPEEMIRASDQIIDILLQRWTVWRERRDHGMRYAGPTKDSRYRTNVQDSHDEEDSTSFADRYSEGGENVRGRLLEGTTTDWRNPHSIEARQNAVRLKKGYAGYQPSVSAASSDADDSPGSTGSKRRAPKKYVLDSGDESSEPEPERAPESEEPPSGTRRRSSSGVPSSEPAEKEVVEAPMKRTLSSPSTNITADQRVPQPTMTYRPPVQPMPSSYQRRPFATPDQNPLHHSFSTPGPAQNNLGRPFQYLPTKGPPQPNAYIPPYPTQQAPYMPQNQSTTPPSSRYVPRLSPQSTYTGSQRPVSREGKPPKSPSRLSYSSHAYSSNRPRETEEERRARKKQLRRDMGDTAARGLLAGGGLVALLEALEALDL